MRIMTFVCPLILLFKVGTAFGNDRRDTAPGNRPNVIIIMADDMGYSDLGCFGGEIHTPNIDRLAKEGLRFTHMYTNAWCSPSRASLLTGLYPQQVGMGLLAEPRTGPKGPYQGYLNEKCVTIAEVLKAAGYRTSLSGKWHLGDSSAYWPVRRGFDHAFGLISGAANYFDITQTKAKNVRRKMALNKKRYTPPLKGFYMTDAITDDAIKVLENQGIADAPFFLYVAYTAPHWPLQALKEDIDKYSGKYNMGWEELRRRRFARQQQFGIVDATSPISSPDPKVKKWNNLTGDVKTAMARKMEVYAAQVDRMDQGVGKILEKLNEIHQEENTIVIFLSDNGGCAEGGIWGFDNRKNGLPPGSVDTYMSYGQSWANASNTPLRYYKKSLMEGGISDPMIIRWPSAIEKERQGSIVTQVAHLTDIMATVCEITNSKYPVEFKGQKIHPLEGQSLVPVIEKGQTFRHQPIYWSLEERKAIIFNDYKLESSADGVPFKLYNLSKDRIETKDLSKENPGRLKLMKGMWRDWARRVGVYEGRRKNHKE